MTTRSEWAVALLAALPTDQTADKVNALVAWASKEDTGAAWNPLATTEDMEGATDYNSVGVKNYASQEVGIAATILTLRNGRYPNLLGLLEDPGPAAIAIATCLPDLDTWGTGPFPNYVEELASGDPQGWAEAPIAGGGSAPTPPPDPAPEPTPEPEPEAPTVNVTLPVLSQGVDGQPTKSAQALLNLRNGNLTVDGIFGAATEQAVREFQSVLNLTVDGIVGQQTWGALLVVG